LKEEQRRRTPIGAVRLGSVKLSKVQTQQPQTATIATTTRQPINVQKNKTDINDLISSLDNDVNTYFDKRLPQQTNNQITLQPSANSIKQQKLQRHLKQQQQRENDKPYEKPRVDPMQQKQTTPTNINELYKDILDKTLYTDYPSEKDNTNVENPDEQQKKEDEQSKSSSKRPSVELKNNEPESTQPKDETNEKVENTEDTNNENAKNPMNATADMFDSLVNYTALKRTRSKNKPPTPTLPIEKTEDSNDKNENKTPLKPPKPTHLPFLSDVLNTPDETEDKKRINDFKIKKQENEVKKPPRMIKQPPLNASNVNNKINNNKSNAYGTHLTVQDLFKELELDCDDEIIDLDELERKRMYNASIQKTILSLLEIGKEYNNKNVNTNRKKDGSSKRNVLLKCDNHCFSQQPKNKSKDKQKKISHRFANSLLKMDNLK
jgi:hypothetical protein